MLGLGRPHRPASAQCATHSEEQRDHLTRHVGGAPNIGAVLCVAVSQRG